MDLTWSNLFFFNYKHIKLIRSYFMILGEKVQYSFCFSYSLSFTLNDVLSVFLNFELTVEFSILLLSEEVSIFLKLPVIDSEITFDIIKLILTWINLRLRQVAWILANLWFERALLHFFLLLFIHIRDVFTN